MVTKEAFKGWGGGCLSDFPPTLYIFHFDPRRLDGFQRLASSRLSKAAESISDVSLLVPPCTQTKVSIVPLKNAARPAGAVGVVTPRRPPASPVMKHAGLRSATSYRAVTAFTRPNKIAAEYDCD